MKVTFIKIAIHVAPSRLKEAGKIIKFNIFVARKRYCKVNIFCVAISLDTVVASTVVGLCCDTRVSSVNYFSFCVSH